jgi:hypothetical protein
VNYLASSWDSSYSFAIQNYCHAAVNWKVNFVEASEYPLFHYFGQLYHAATLEGKIYDYYFYYVNGEWQLIVRHGHGERDCLMRSFSWLSGLPRFVGLGFGEDGFYGEDFTLAGLAERGDVWEALFLWGLREFYRLFEFGRTVEYTGLRLRAGNLFFSIPDPFAAMAGKEALARVGRLGA